MKSSFDIDAGPRGRFREIGAYDRREIDNPDRHHPWRLQVLDRLHRVLGVIAERFPRPEGIRVGDFACAQGNAGLLLAERGYRVVCVDLNPLFIEYARQKHEKGEVEWVVGNLEELRFEPESFHVVILGEIVEHCAHPEEIVARAGRSVRPGGILIITTPNGGRIGTGLPTYGQLPDPADRKGLEQRQFGPDGTDHLFLFRRGELPNLVPAGFRLAESGYAGGCVLVNRFSYRLFKFLPASVLLRLVRLAAGLPLLGRLTCNNIYAVLERTKGHAG
jgi:SAM-dependent methyltransferase